MLGVVWLKYKSKIHLYSVLLVENRLSCHQQNSALKFNLKKGTFSLCIIIIKVGIIGTFEIFCAYEQINKQNRNKERKYGRVKREKKKS